MSTKEALEGKHVAYYFSSQAVEDQLEKAAQGQEAVRPTPTVKEVAYSTTVVRCTHMVHSCTVLSAYKLVGISSIFFYYETHRV